MENNKDTTRRFSVLNEVKLSAQDKADILQTLRIEMNRKQPKKRFNRGAISGFAAAVAAVAIVAGGFDFEMHNHHLRVPSPSKNVATASNQTRTSTHTNTTTNTSTNSTSNSNMNTSTSDNTVNSTNNSTPSKGVASNPTHNGSGIHKNSQTSSNYSNEIAAIKNKGYSVSRKTPNATVKTTSGETLSAWLCILSASQDGHNQRVLFFLNGQYVGMDAEPSPEIISAAPAGAGSIAVTYAVYKHTDILANPTGTPDTITYHWNGSKLVPNKSMPKQFS